MSLVLPFKDKVKLGSACISVKGSGKQLWSSWQRPTTGLPAEASVVFPKCKLGPVQILLLAMREL